MFDIGDVLSRAWEGFKAHVGVLIPALLIAGVVIVVVVAPLAVATDFAVEAGDGGTIAIFILIRIVVETLINALVQMGFITINLKIARGQNPEIGDLFANFGRLPTAFLLNLLLFMLIMTGFVLLIIPGIILALMTCLAMWFVVDRNMGVFAAIQASIDATKGSLLNLFLFGIVAVLLVIAGAIPCGLGLLIVGPMIGIATAYIYESLTEPEYASDEGEFEESPY